MNWKSIIIVICSAVVLSSKAMAFDLMVGVNSSVTSLDIEDLALDDAKLAGMNKGQIYPSVGVRTDLKYFSEDSNWMYFYQFDGAIFEFNKQEITSSHDLQDVGTSIKGFSLFAVPTAAYHFNKGSVRTWSYKAGMGLGLAYLHMKGNFRITMQEYPEYAQVKDVNVNAMGFTIGFFLEASSKKHSIVFQNFAPMVDDEKYSYEQHNIELMYRYKFTY